MAGLTLQISEVAAQIALEDFLVDAEVRAIGQLDDSLNNEDYDYATIQNAVATPWRQDNPLKPIGYKEGYLKIADVLMVFPVEPSAQQSVNRMLGEQAVILYLQNFAVHGRLTMAQEMTLSGVMEAFTRRYLVMIDASVFPLFPANTAMPENMPVLLVNRAAVSHYHPSEE